MPEKPPLRPEEVRRILRELAPLSEDRRIVLVGGQAVAFWAAFFKLKSRSAEQEIFTSKDNRFRGRGENGTEGRRAAQRRGANPAD